MKNKGQPSSFEELPLSCPPLLPHSRESRRHAAHHVPGCQPRSSPQIWHLPHRPAQTKWAFRKHVSAALPSTWQPNHTLKTPALSKQAAQQTILPGRLSSSSCISCLFMLLSAQGPPTISAKDHCFSKMYRNYTSDSHCAAACMTVFCG